jgi:hypothetical protein
MVALDAPLEALEAATETTATAAIVAARMPTRRTNGSPRLVLIGSPNGLSGRE